MILSSLHRSIEGCCVPGGKDAEPRKASAAAQDDGADSDEDWSRGGKASKGKKGGKAKKAVRLHECPDSSQAHVHPCGSDWSQASEGKKGGTAKKAVRLASSHWKQCSQSLSCS